MKPQQQSISIEKAAATLNVPVSYLEQICKQDKDCKLHHRTVYSAIIRINPSDLDKIRKHIKP